MPTYTDYSPRKTPIETTGKSGLNYHTGTTRVYTAGHSTVWHADRRCPELRDVSHARLYPLGHVLTTDANPVKPCELCTCDIEQNIRVAIQFDGVDRTDILDEYDQP